MTQRDLALAVPLSGVQLIEASAGTGKTFTLSLVYARLVIEARLDVDAILAVTYTRAAAAELRERLRLQLQDALRRLELGGIEPDSDAPVERLLAAALQREPLPQLLARLRRAVAALDVAPIHTIHAFCQRALADHGLAAGLPPRPQELLANERELQLEVATAFWRRNSRSPAGARALDELASGPAVLAQQLRELLATEALEPPASPIDEEEVRAEVEYEGLLAALADAVRSHADDAFAQLHAASAAGALNLQRFKPAQIEALREALEAWLVGADPATLPERLPWLGQGEIDAKLKAGAKLRPRSPLFDAIGAVCAARSAAADRRWRRSHALLHALRAEGGAELAQLKRQRGLVGYDDLIHLVAAALAPDADPAFAQRLRAQYRVALVDEFQDTDPRQYAIFRRLFVDPVIEDAAASDGDGDGAARALFLIGDPKQAIYRFRGGDVFTYQIARHQADARHALAHNFRSRPRVLQAVEALFAVAGESAFAQADIIFTPVAPGGEVSDADFVREGRAAPALFVHRLDAIDPKLSIDAARAAAAWAGAAAVLDLLRAGATGEARVRRKGERELVPVAPGDVAVLVETNDDALLMRDALAALGIPCVVAGRESLFASSEAAELRRVLLALRAPGDEARLRAALATVLLGLDAHDIAALDRDEAAQRAWQERAFGWRQRLERHGPLALVTALCAEHAARLLQREDGERLLANWLQLGELLQELAAAAPGVDALVDAFERRIEDADRDNEDELPRLESDAARVQVLTLHKSKGLEFEFVFLPLIATHGARNAAAKFARYHDGERRCLYRLGAGSEDAAVPRALEREQERAEKLRLLYVGLTRARQATWIVWGAAKGIEHCALSWLLHRAPGADEVAVPDAEGIAADLRAWQQRAPDAIEVRPALETDLRFDPPREPMPAPARRAQRVLARDWWVYSYSLLAREERNDPEADAVEQGAEDEVVEDMPAPLAMSRLSGVRFGNALHAALERADFARWRDWDQALPPPGEADAIAAALRAEGFTSEADQVQGLALMTSLIAATLNVRLPEGLRLCELARGDRRDEMEFHLHLAPTAIPALIALLHAHGIVRERHGFGLRRRIEGLLTGRIDLVYRHEGRFYVLDYKSNRLPAYDAATLEAAVRDSEYDLQYVLYTLALHRWLRFRLGAAYDYERDLGGVRYVFCRGLDPARDRGDGIHACRPPRALIEALDRLFAGAAESAA
jgi:exodeoxyribonuclease V beta subunit